MPEDTGPRFLTISDVAEELAVTNVQVKSLIKSQSLPAIQIGGRGQWRIERSKLEEYIEDAYRRAQQATADEAAKKNEPGDQQDD
ncbi:helix-turn-helix domain-containing protein [Arthrobacter pigmenti]